MTSMPNTETRINELLCALTLEEKIKLLGGWKKTEGEERTGDIYGIDRIGLPALKFADGPVGVHWWTRASTCYPALICLAATFDEQTAFEYGEGVGTDCRAAGVHVLLAPGVNLYRSPLCGRNFEYLGEDPELSGKTAAAYIRGVQSKGVAATVKHFAANNQEYDRHGISSDIDARTLREVYLRPFELAVKEGGTACLMTSYNPVNQIHASEHHELIEQILRGEWGCEGLVMSDWTSVYSTAQTLAAGLDLEMPWGRHLNVEKIRPLLETGVVTEALIDRRIRKRLELMARFGWLDPEHRQHDAALPDRNPATEAVALNVARRGIVLLKNEGLLPKPPAEVRRITVLGHHAGREIICGGGSAYTPPHEAVSLERALRTVYGENVDVICFPVLDLWRAEAAFVHPDYRTPDGQPGLRAEYFNNPDLAGAPAAVRTDQDIRFRWIEGAPDPAVNSIHYSGRWTGTFEVEQDEPCDFYIKNQDGACSFWIDEELMESAVAGSGRFSVPLAKGRHALRVEFRTTHVGWVHHYFGFEPARLAQCDYEKALASAKESDLTVVTAGFVAETEGESHDRPFELDAHTVQLLCDAAEVSDNVAAVLYIGGAVQTEPWLDKVRAALCLWYPGQNGTLAAAEIIAGRTNPSGKLPFTWEKQLADRGSFCCYHDEDGDRRIVYADGVFTGYRWFDLHHIEPRFPFGHGLSYTSFAYENLRLLCSSIRAGEPLNLEFDIANTGAVAGAESALVFVSDPEAGVPRPLKEFKMSKRVRLDPGERRTVHITLPARAFAYWDVDRGDWNIEPGAFIISVGPNAAELPLQNELIVTA